MATRIDFSLPAAGAGDRDFHLHGFDEGDVVAIADAGADFDGKRADAPGDLGDDLISGMPIGFLLWRADCLR